MRLSKQEISIIKKVILKNISDAKIFLFGSRIYDDKKGGDIDLFVETLQNINLDKKLDILTELEFNGIERKIDLILKTPTSKNQKIFETIYKEGIKL